MKNPIFTDDEIAGANHNTYLVEALMDAIRVGRSWPREQSGYGTVQEHVALWQAAVDRAIND